MSDIKQPLRKLIAATLKRDINPETIKGDDLISELGITSVDSLELLIAVEAEFGISIHDEDLNQRLVSSLDALSQYIQQRQLDGAAAASA